MHALDVGRQKASSSRRCFVVRYLCSRTRGVDVICSNGDTKRSDMLHRRRIVRRLCNGDFAAVVTLKRELLNDVKRRNPGGHPESRGTARS